jgi:hypothetical protein
MLCRMMGVPTPEAWAAGLHLVAFLYATKDMGVKMTCPKGTPRVSTWYDASNKADQGARWRTVGGFVIYIGDSPIEWLSKLLTHASQSAQHSEYQALAMACKGTMWIRHLVADMGFAAWVSLPTPLLGDNNAAITLARNDILTQGNRFYTPDLHYAKEVYENGWCCPRKVAHVPGVNILRPCVGRLRWIPDDVIQGRRLLCFDRQLRRTSRLCRLLLRLLPCPGRRPGRRRRGGLRRQGSLALCRLILGFRHPCRSTPARWSDPRSRGRELAGTRTQTGSALSPWAEGYRPTYAHQQN